MATTTTTTNKPLNPRAQDLSPKGYNRAALYSGKALDFDGVNDNIIVNGVDSVFDYGNAYTMAGYFKIVDGGSGSLMGNSNGNAFGNFLGFVYKSGDDSNFYPDGSSSNFVTIYSGNTTGFVYIVCTSDGTTAKAYLNGEFVGSTSVSSYTNTGSQFNVGSSYSGNFGEHEAAGVKIFNTALTAAQVADLYLNPEKIVPDGVASSALKLWLPMMEGAGTTAYDGSGNGNHGTISGATWVSGIGAPVAQTALVSWNKGTNSQPTQTSPVLLPQGLTANKDITGVNAFESARNPYALNLDGASWAEVHDNASLDFGTGSFTLEAWARVKYVESRFKAS
jgi:hypothetical protein